MRKLLVILTAIGVLFGAACCEDDGSNSSTTSAATTTSTSTTTSVPTTTSPSITTTSSTTTTVPETATTTLSIWESNPRWCDGFVSPGEHVAEDVLQDYTIVDSELAFIFIRVLEVLGYEDLPFQFEHTTGTISGSVRFWKIRASVLETEDKAYEDEFTIGILTVFSIDPLRADAVLEVSSLISNRVPFDDCFTGQEPPGQTRRDYIDGTWTFVRGQYDAEMLQVGRVYPVGIRITLQPGCVEDDRSTCRFSEPFVAHNAQLFEALRTGDLEKLDSLAGWGQIERVFVPSRWYNFAEIEDWRVTE